MEDKKKEELEDLVSSVAGKKFDELSSEEMEQISGAVKDVDSEGSPIVAISVSACVSFLTGVISWTVKGK